MCERAEQEHMTGDGPQILSDIIQKETKNSHTRNNSNSCHWVDVFFSKAGSYNTNEPLSNDQSTDCSTAVADGVSSMESSSSSGSYSSEESGPARYYIV